MNFKLDNNFNIQNTSFVFLTWSSMTDRKSTRLNSSHMSKSYAVFCLKKKIEVILFVLCRWPDFQHHVPLVGEFESVRKKIHQNLLQTLVISDYCRVKVCAALDEEPDV